MPRSKGNVKLDTKQGVNWEVLSLDTAADGLYITVILDLWQGDRDDPVTQVNRYIALFDVDDVEELLAGGDVEGVVSFDPDYYGFKVKPDPLVWEQFLEVKEADDAAVQHSRNEEHLMDPERGWGTTRVKSDLYIKFIAAIDVLAENYEDEAAWADIDAWRNYQAHMHER